MKIDLCDVPARVISLPQETARREHIAKHFTSLGISFAFIDGINGPKKIPSVAKAHKNAFESIHTLPFMVFEDDVYFCGDSLVLPDIPDDADIVYLGKNDDGCMPNQDRFRDRFGHRSLTDLALASGHDANWLRLHSMVSAHAILFLTERAKQECLEAQRISINRVTPLDVRYAYLMSSLNVYTPRKPLFAEAAELQPPGKSVGRRLGITHGALLAAKAGDVRHTEKRGEGVTVKVVETGNGRLAWDLHDDGT